MDNTRNQHRRGIRAGMIVAAVALVVTGVTAWHGLAADPQRASAAAVSAPSPQITRSVAGGRDSYADIVKVVAPGVVTIRTEGKARISPTDFQDGQDPSELFRRFFGNQFQLPPQSQQGQRGQRQRPNVQPRQRERALGSGVVVTSDGYILTNDHVVDNADDIKVDLTDGRTMTAKVVGTDTASDLALIKVTATDLHPLSFGNSDGVQVGDVVLAVGNPLGVGQTVTMGIISAKGRSTENDKYEDFLQTDAPINHGNSGGALVNTKGELVGINSQIASVSDGNIGIGFAIPVNMAKHVMDDLKTNGRVRRGQIGVVIAPITSDVAESLGLKQVSGVIVASVNPGSAAEHAGLKRNDIIKSFNGQPVQDVNSLRNHVADLGPGASATLVVDRDGTDRNITVKLDEVTADKSARDGSAPSNSDADKSSLGISVEPLTPELAQRAGLPRTAHGILIEGVNPDSRAADAGMQAGDLIEEVNRQAVSSVDDLRAAVKKAGERPVLLLVNREGQERFVTVRPS